MLQPLVLPPQPLHTETQLNATHENSTSTRTTTKKPVQVQVESIEKQLIKFNTPLVSLNVDKISSSMAARLAASLLCHVLFLKSQIPFPVVQLARMPGAQSNAKTVKKREELMDAVDTLSSHLQTTFTALSTAYAIQQESINKNGDEKSTQITESAYLAYVLGSSVGAAKARVIFAVNGLEAKTWGTKSEIDVARDSVSDVDDSDDDSEKSNSSLAEDIAEGETVSEGGSQLGDSEDEPALSPPPSRSPSPISRPSSPLTSVLNTPPPTALFRAATSPPPAVIVDKSPPKSSRGLSENTPPSAPPRRSPLSLLGPLSQKTSPKPLGFAIRPDGENAPPRLRPTQSISAPPARLPLSQKFIPRITPKLTQSYDEEQQALRAADRLLSRTLANACAEDDGGLSAELAPTQTHVLLRAPRCFSHPSWVPRQNLTRTLESQLQSFLQDSIQCPSADAASIRAKKSHRSGVKTEGVWVTCANGGSPKAPHITSTQDEPVHEDDEMIWWVWNGGKIVGFSDW